MSLVRKKGPRKELYGYWQNKDILLLIPTLSRPWFLFFRNINQLDRTIRWKHGLWSDFLFLANEIVPRHFSSSNEPLQRQFVCPLWQRALQDVGEGEAEVLSKCSGHCHAVTKWKNLEGMSHAIHRSRERYMFLFNCFFCWLIYIMFHNNRFEAICADDDDSTDGWLCDFAWRRKRSCTGLVRFCFLLFSKIHSPLTVVCGSIQDFPAKCIFRCCPTFFVCRTGLHNFVCESAKPGRGYRQLIKGHTMSMSHEGWSSFLAIYFFKRMSMTKQSI